MLFQSFLSPTEPGAGAPFLLSTKTSDNMPICILSSPQNVMQMQVAHGLSTPPYAGYTGLGQGVAAVVGGPGRPRVGAYRGQAGNTHSTAEQLHCEGIAERMKAFQEPVPNSNKCLKQDGTSAKMQLAGFNVVDETMNLTITQPDDWHLHLRDENYLSSVVRHSADVFKRAIIMPNLKPPVTTVAAAHAYRQRILRALPHNSPFVPLMTLYLTDSTSAKEIRMARESGVVSGVKLYPAGATTNSQAGVTDLFGKCMPVLEEMVHQGLPLLVHGEVSDKIVDVFDRESSFIAKILQPLVNKLPQLKIVMEHITTREAVQFVKSCQEGFVGATVTPQHLLLNRNAIFQDGLRPHNYCLPILKREIHREAIFSAVTSGSKQFFLGTDSAPHERHAKEAPCGCAGIYNAPVALPLYTQAFEQAGALDKLEAFTSFNGPDFYGLPRNTSKITLAKRPWTVPEEYSFGSGTVVPMFAGRVLDWAVI